MDSIDRPDSNVPARFPADSPRAPAPLPAPPRDLALAANPPSQVSPQVVLRALGRHWWRILLFWLAASTPLAYLIYELVEPTYEAVSQLQVEPTQPELFSPSGLRDPGDLKAAQPYLQTQVGIITSDTVLEDAIANPAVVNLPMIKNSADPKADLLENMVVEVTKGTYLIRVALESGDAREAAAIVNAVVDAYLKKHNEYHRSANHTLKESLQKELTKLAGEITKKQDELKALVKEGSPAVAPKPVLSPRAPEKDGEAGFELSFSSVPETLYAHAAEELLRTDMQLIEAEADLKAAEKARKQAAEGQEPRPAEDEELQARIVEEFQRDPAVIALIDQITETEEQLEDAKSKARKASSDPAATALRKHHRRLLANYDELWKAKYNEIARKLRDGAAGLAPDAWGQKIALLQAQVEKLRLKKADLAGRIAKLQVENKAQNNDTLNYALMQQDLANLLRMQGLIQEKLKQLDFEIGQDKYRVELIDRARPPQVPSNNKRLKYMAAAPVGILVLMLGLFLMLEVKAERVGDPEALSSRVQSEVYALPPLPTARSLRKRSLSQVDDQIEQFIQRLDHLRFAVCGNPAELEQGRCVLITSAIGGEGKTTLAAQLAARCGHAGMSTLLIDADLRRTGLGPLLEIPEGPGLSDALLHDQPAPPELVVPVQGGTFHLLPAGTPVPDTSRVLQSRKLGLLLTQFRQLYDLIIIDSPPVLPVPDALIIGRWVDGAVLAVRYDISRFPQVERARRQLDGAGIAVLGTVINGMRHSDSYYGRYSYSRRRPPQPDPSGAI